MKTLTGRFVSPLLIVVAIIASLATWNSLPELTQLPMQAMFPFPVADAGDSAPRWVATLLLPMVAALLWIGFELARTSAGLRLMSRMFGNLPAALSESPSIERSGATYDTIVLWVIILLLGSHAGLLTTALGFQMMGARIVALSIGVSMLAMGNVMPRLRPNLIAGIRTRRALADPSVWRSAHRFLGYAFVASGVATIAVALIAPAYGLLTALATILVSTVGAGIVSRSSGASTAVIAVLLVAAVGRAESQPAIPAVPVAPAPPAGVSEQPFEFQSGGLTLHGTLAIPARTSGPVPVILMVAGSGPTDRNTNGPMVNTNAFAMLAGSLAQQGIATLRYDKRGIGASVRPDGDPSTLTLDLYVADVLEGVRALVADKQFSRVFLLGHSEGAGHVLQAANRGASVAGVVMVAGQGRRLQEMLHAQFSAAFDSATVTQIDSSIARYLRGDDPGDVHPAAAPLLQPQNFKFWRSWAAYDPEAEARRYQGSLLILQGTTDAQVSMADAELLARAHPSATFVPLRDVNHVLKVVPSVARADQIASYQNPSLPLAPTIVPAIVQWLAPLRPHLEPSSPGPSPRIR